jgi:hypothetical protein
MKIGSASQVRKHSVESQSVALPDDSVEEASKESFPASDSPDWNAGQDPPSPDQEK